MTSSHLSEKPQLKVMLCSPRGFCAGVVRAIDTVERALTIYGAPVYVRHEIVHNRHVVDDLRAKGARFVDELDEIPLGGITVFSAHGVSRQVEREAEERGLSVLDATCPLVSKVHVQGQGYVDQGRTVILIGHAGHPEVVGTMGQLTAPVHLVQNSSGEYACQQTSGQWSCDKVTGVSASGQNALIDFYTPGHWVKFLSLFALAAGIAGDKVTTSTMSLNGFSMNCIDLQTPGTTGTSTICTTSQGVLGFAQVASGPFVRSSYHADEMVAAHASADRPA